MFMNTLNFPLLPVPTSCSSMQVTTTSRAMTSKEWAACRAHKPVR
jgi:hypothetical protein